MIKQDKELLSPNKRGRTKSITLMKTKWLKQKESLVKAVGINATGHIILFGSFTTPPWEGGGGGGGGQPTFPGNDPFPGGDPGSGGPGGGCEGYGGWLTGNTALSSDLVSEETTDIDATHRTITYTWIPFKQVANIWRFESRELGTQEKIGGAWRFTGFSHLGVILAGITPGFTLQWTDYLPPATSFTTYLATITLNFRVRTVFYCGGAPFEYDLTFVNGSKNGYAQHHFPV